jgi:hypothetical protein
MEPAVAAAAPRSDTPSKGMCKRVLKHARNKKKEKETSDPDKKHLGKMIRDGSRKEGLAYDMSTTFWDDPCSQELMEEVLDAQREDGDGRNE